MSGNLPARVRAEKDRYEAELNQQAEDRKENLEAKDDLIPYSEITSTTVKKLLKDYYDEEVLEHLEITRTNMKQLARSLRTMDKNLIKSSSVLICKGAQCPMSQRCVLQKSKLAPVGHSCPVEMMLVDQWEKMYMEDLGVDSQSKVELDLVRDMIEADLIDWRTSNEISKNGLFDWNAIGTTQDGKPIIKKEESVAIGIKLKFKARKDKLREDLLATRKIKAKFGIDKQLDPAKFASDLQQRFRDIQDAEVSDVKK